MRFSLRRAKMAPHTAIILWACVLAVLSSTTNGAVVSWVSPDHGSVAGGTKVTIYGSGFSQDVYAGGNVIMMGDVPCMNVWFYSTTTTIVCITAAMKPPHQTTGPLPVTVIVDNTDVSECRGSCSFSFLKSESPSISRINPSGAPAGALISVEGSVFSDDMSLIQRIYVGDNFCNMRDTSLNYYGAQWLNWPAMSIQCKPQETKVGYYDIRTNIPSRGDSYAELSAIKVSPSLELYMFQIVPEIQSFSPAHGSVEGGSVITVTGTGFGVDAGKLDVKVGGVPCAVDPASLTDTSFSCVIDGRFTSTEKAFAGNRGARMDLFFNIDGDTVASLRHATSFPNNPQYSTVLIGEMNGPLNQYDRYGTRIVASFTPPVSDNYTFFVATDDNAELRLGHNLDGSDAQAIVSFGAWVYPNRWYDYPQQRSAPVPLAAGVPVYLEVLCKEYYGLDTCAVGAHADQSPYSEKETGSAVQEVQTVRASVTVTYERQVVSIAGEHAAGSFVLQWDGVATRPLFANSTADNVTSAIHALLGTGCQVVDGDDVYDLDNFEAGSSSSDDWTDRYGYGNPTIVTNAAFCGRRSLYFPTPLGRAFEGSDGLEAGQTSAGYSTRFYPYMCMALRINPNTRANMLVYEQLRGWLSITITDVFDNFKYPRIGTWDSADSPVTADGEWHYKCIDVNAMLDEAFPDDPDHVLSALILYPPWDDYSVVGGEMWIDEFAISSLERDVRQVSPPARPGGVVVDHVEVTRGITSNAVNFGITIYPVGCPTELPLLEAYSGNLNVSVSRAVNASAPLGGNFTLSFGGKTSKPIRYDADEYAMAQALYPLIGRSSVSAQQSGCYGRSWTVTFDSRNGRQPLLSTTSALAGTNANMGVSEVRLGGLFFAPIQADMLRTIHAKPQVVVTRTLEDNSTFASVCSVSGGCDFDFREADVAPVTQIQPTAGASGTRVTLSGGGFAANTTVAIGGAPCLNVEVVSDSTLRCTVGHQVAGPNDIVVIVPGKGRGRSSVRFMYELSTVGMSRSVSSIAGGLELTIAGNGFSPVPSDNLVSIEGVGICAVVESSFVQLTCITPVSTAGEAANKTVNVAVRGLSVAVGQISFLESATRRVDRVNPPSGSVGGGTMVTVFGHFAVGDDVKVMIGDVPCKVHTFGIIYIACITGPGTLGSMNVSVHIDGLGLATSTTSFNYVLAVTSASASAGSALGGQVVTLAGVGFSDTYATLRPEVSVAGAPCVVQAHTNTEITCITTATQRTYRVTNEGVNPEYGLGYAWSPPFVEIDVGDTVEWAWTSTAVTGTLHSVEQVANAAALSYDGSGFRSERSGDGYYALRFTAPGMYQYVSADNGEIGMRGMVVVRPRPAVTGTVSVSLGRGNAALNATFLRSTDTTPVVISATPANGCPGDMVVLQGAHFGSGASAQVRIGETPCAAVTQMGADILACIVPDMPAGVYRFGVTFSDVGIADVRIPGGVFSVRPRVESVDPRAGSRMGGHEIHIRGSGFGDSGSRVFVGHSECAIQSHNSTAITCRTSAATNEGYAAALEVDAAVFTDTFDDAGEDGTRTAGLVGSAGLFVDRVESAPLDPHTSDALFGNHSSGYSFELWVRPAIDPLADAYTLVAGAFGAEAGAGAALLIGPTGRLEFWVGAGEGRKARQVLDWNNAEDLAALFGDDARVFEEATHDEDDLVHHRRLAAGEDLFSNLASGTATATQTATATATATATVGITSVLMSPTPTLLPLVLPGRWSVVDGPAVPVGEWTHVVGVVVSGTQRLYINGTEVASVAVSPSPCAPAAVIFGGPPVGIDGVANFTGTLDEAALYRGALGAPVVRSHVRYAETDAQPAYVVGLARLPRENDVGFVAPYYEVVAARVGTVVHTRDGSLENVGVPSACAGDICFYEFLAALTPVVTDISPASGNGQLDVTVFGSGFSSVLRENIVDFDGVRCTVTSVGASSLTCSIPPTRVGRRSVRVAVAHKGLADSSSAPKFAFTLTATAATPVEGSIAGGTVLSLAGNGFSPVAADNAVTVDGAPCTVTAASETSIQCETTPHTAGTALRITVAVGEDSATIAGAFGYTDNATPHVNFVQPSTGRANTTLLVFGSKFSTDLGKNKVTVGGVDCKVTAATSSQIACTVGANVAGVHKVVVRVNNLGYSIGSATFTHGLYVDSVAPVQSGFGGGVLMRIDGDGFDGRPGNASANAISVCSATCVITSASFAHIECLLSRFPGLAPPTTDTQCSVVAHVNGREGTWSSQYLFRTAWTAVVTGFSPKRGGTQGGTVLTIVGKNFNPASTVTIGGSECHIASINLTTVVCVTGPHVTSRTAPIRVNAPEWGDAFAVDATFDYIDRWSSCATWGNSCNKPVDGDIVYVRKDQTLLLDIKSPVLEAVVVEGALVFDRADGVELDAKYVLINNGRLEIGTEAEPFMNRATITLHGNIQDTELPVYGSKVLACRNCSLDIHGRPLNVTWTTLALTAGPGSTSIRVRDAVGEWNVGDRIVIASTSFNSREAEVVTITGLADGNTTVLFAEPLSFSHTGESVTVGDRTFDVRAEVGLLSRNVVIQGALDPEQPLGDTFGAQVFVHMHQGARLAHFEVRHAGQAFRLGRYPLHFHMPGVSANSYIRGCSVHHTFNRAVTMHGVHQLRVENNVAYNVMGHTYFLEDGIESENIVRNNLGVRTRSSASLLNTDQAPATFWITNPRNHYVGNAAGGSEHAGYWFNLPDNPTGPSQTWSVCPNQAMLGTFLGNTAHSNDFGVRVWEKWIPRARECNGGALVTAELRATTAYANRRGIEFSDVGHLRILDSAIADSADSNIEITKVQGSWGGPLVANTIVVGRTGLLNGFAGSATGLRTPMSEKLTVENVTFVNFDAPNQAMLRGCSFCTPFKPFDGGMETRFRGIVKINAPNVAAFQWEHEVLWRDLDGSLIGGRGWALPTNGLANPAICTPSDGFSRGFPGMTCTDAVEFRRIAWNNLQPSSLNGFNAVLSNSFGNTSVPWREKRLTHANGYMATVPLYGDVTLSYAVAAKDRVDVTSYSMGAALFGENDYLTLSLHYQQHFNHFVIAGVEDDAMRPVLSNDTLGTYHFDNATMTNTFIITGKGHSGDSLDFSYFADRCPKGGCPRPPSNDTNLPAGTRRWSDASGWPSGQVPGDGDNAIVGSNQIVLLDCDTARLNLLTVAGQLIFVDGEDRELTATYIHVRGGRIAIGNSTVPFRNRATISLTGNRTTPELTLTSRINMGAKSLGVFGNVDMFGTPPNVTWTRLAVPAVAGAVSVTLSQPVPWKVGDQIVIGPTGYDPAEGELRVITGVSTDRRVLSFQQPLAHRHAATKSTYGSRSITMAAEVGLLTRNIVVRGLDDGEGALAAEFGGRILVGAYQYTADMGASIPTVLSGRLRMVGVELRNCGQRGWPSPADPRHAVAFKDLLASTAAASYIRRSAFNWNFNSAVGVHTSEGVELSDNVVYRTVGSAIYTTSKSTTITNNLAMYVTIALTDVADPGFSDESAAFDVRVALCVVRGNAASGSDRHGFRVRGDSCSTPAADGQPAYYNNSAHGALMCFKLEGAPACTLFAGFRAYKCWDFGIYSSIESSIIVRDFAVADAHLGLFLGVFGPSSVRHFSLDKTVNATNGLVVGISDEGSCSDAPPPHVSRMSSPADAARTGLVLTSFTMEKILGPPHGWDEIMSYPALYGTVNGNGLTFANFGQDSCGRWNHAIATNPKSPDATHPHLFAGVEWVGVPDEGRLFYHETDPAWINPTDCIDMDCDGLKHVIVTDVDGSFFGATGGTIIPIAEIRFDESKIPPAALKAPGGRALSAADVAPFRGIVRDGLSCERVQAWNAYRCAGGTHRLLIIESLDSDTETRRLSPLSLTADGTMDLLNGPQDHGWCEHYTCLKRLSTFFAVVGVRRNYTLYMTGTNPGRTRFHLPSASPDEGIVISTWYSNPQRIDVYRDGRYIEPENNVFVPGTGNTPGSVESRQGPQFIPSVLRPAAANYYERRTKLVHVVLRGRAILDVVLSPVVQIGLTLGMSIDTFYGPQLIFNLATLLGADPSRIKVVDVVAESASSFRHGRASDAATTINLQIGNPPANTVSMPTAPTVSESDDDSGSSGGADNSTDTAAQDAYAAQQNALADLNSIGEKFVALVQSNSLAAGLGVEVLGADIQMAVSTSPPPDGSTDPNAGNSGGSNAPIQVPATMTLSATSTGVLANTTFNGMFQLEVRDGSGVLVNQLGILTPWNASVTIDTMANETAPGAQLSLGGTTVAYFSGGRANFTNVILTVLNSTQQQTVRLRFTTGNNQFSLKSSEISISYPGQSNAPAPSTNTQQASSASGSLAPTSTPAGTPTGAAASSAASSAGTGAPSNPAATSAPATTGSVAPSPAPPVSASLNSSSANKGAIIGGVVAGAVVLIAACVGGYMWYTRTHQTWTPKRVDIRPEELDAGAGVVAPAPAENLAPMMAAPLAVNTVMSSAAGGVSFEPPTPLPPLGAGAEAPISLPLPPNDPMNVKQPMDESSPRYARFVAKRNYVPKFPDEVALAVGDIVQVTDSTNASWYMGLNTTSHKWGRLPKHCVEPLQSPAASPLPQPRVPHVEPRIADPFAVPEVEAAPPSLLGDVVPHSIDEPRPRTPTRSPVMSQEAPREPSIQDELKSSQNSGRSGGSAD